MVEEVDVQIGDDPPGEEGFAVAMISADDGLC